MANVAINGLGRIGRAALKIILGTPELNLVVANDVATAENLAYLLRFDTVYGRYDKPVKSSDGRLSIGGQTLRLLSEKDRETIARLVPEIGCPTNIMAGPGAPAIAELEQLGVTRVTFGTGLMRATLPLIRQMAQEVRASGICDSLAQTEFTHVAVNQLFKK